MWEERKTGRNCVYVNVRLLADAYVFSQPSSTEPFAGGNISALRTTSWKVKLAVSREESRLVEEYLWVGRVKVRLDIFLDKPCYSLA